MSKRKANVRSAVCALIGGGFTYGGFSLVTHFPQTGPFMAGAGFIVGLIVGCQFFMSILKELFNV